MYVIHMHIRYMRIIASCMYGHNSCTHAHTYTHANTHLLTTLYIHVHTAYSSANQEEGSKVHQAQGRMGIRGEGQGRGSQHGCV
jgi:hypothetical protein